LHEGVAPAVVFIVSMLAPVDFNDEPFFPAGEICEVRAYRKLAGEFVAAELATLELEPKQGFGLVVTLP
jgi:hypothetical protein